MRALAIEEITVRRTTPLIAAVAMSLLLAACNETSQPLQAAPAPAPAGTTDAPVPSLDPATDPAAPEATSSPTPSPTYSPKPPSYDVKLVQRQLTEQHYYVGAIDGERGLQLRAAVMAFQKVNGLAADGGVGPKTLAALKSPKKPTLKGSGSGTRVEVDLTKQVLYVVKNGAITRILPISSGSGEKYKTKSGSTATALSPVGYYQIQRRIVGERKADLGTLYDPQYFYRGWAIHGSNSVPAYPASHGCIRVTRTDAKWLLGQIGVGTRVYLYGGTHVFTAGSSAPGTDDPGGDTATPAPSPSATPSPSASPKPSPSSSPSPKPSPTASPAPTILPSPKSS